MSGAKKQLGCCLVDSQSILLSPRVLPFRALGFSSLPRTILARVEMWQTNYFHQMRSSDEIVDFVRGTALLPYLARLDEARSTEFLRMLKIETAAHYKPGTNGTVLFPFYRVLFLAQ